MGRSQPAGTRRVARRGWRPGDRTLFWRRLSRWFGLTYGCLVVGAVATNAEHLLKPRTLNLVEHAVGNMGAGLASAVAAYVYRRHNVVDPEQTSDDPVADSSASDSPAAHDSAGDNRPATDDDPAANRGEGEA